MSDLKIEDVTKRVLTYMHDHHGCTFTQAYDDVTSDLRESANPYSLTDIKQYIFDNPEIQYLDN